MQMLQLKNKGEKRCQLSDFVGNQRQVVNNKWDWCFKSQKYGTQKVSSPAVGPTELPPPSLKLCFR
jgi:hypothetical protein